MPARQPRLTGDQRRAVAQVLAERYREGASIRSLAVETGRSYGLVQRLLAEAGVEFRPRGGADPASPATRAVREEEPGRPCEEPQRQDPPEQREDPGQRREESRKERKVAKKAVSEEELEKAESKVRKAEQRLGKALRARAKTLRLARMMAQASGETLAEAHVAAARRELEGA